MLLKPISMMKAAAAGGPTLIMSDSFSGANANLDGRTPDTQQVSSNTWNSYTTVWQVDGSGNANKASATEYPTEYDVGVTEGDIRLSIEHNGVIPGTLNILVRADSGTHNYQFYSYTAKKYEIYLSSTDVRLYAHTTARTQRDIYSGSAGSAVPQSTSSSYVVRVVYTISGSTANFSIYRDGSLLATLSDTSGDSDLITGTNVGFYWQSSTNTSTRSPLIEVYGV